MEIKSTLTKIIEDVYKSKNLDEAKSIALTLLEDSKIKSVDRLKMINDINNTQTLVKLQFYMTNAMFKYEGLGIN